MLGCARPDRLIEHIGDDPELVKKLASMRPASRRHELAKLEAQLYPNDAESGGPDPAWLREMKGGKAKSLNDPTITDADFEAAFKKRFYTDKSFDRSKFGR
jgi:hypothetical protein